MITAIYVQEQFQTAYETIREYAKSDDGEQEILFPPYESLFVKEKLIEACEPYVDVFERLTRVPQGCHYYLLDLCNYSVLVHINGENEIILLHFSITPLGDPEVAKRIMADLQGIVKARVAWV